MRKDISIVSILIFGLGIIFLILFRNFINSNEAFFSTIFALIITVATVFYAVLTRSLVNETIKMRKIHSNPKISLEIIPQERWINFLDFEIKNIGNGMAYNIEIETINESDNPIVKILEDMEIPKRKISHLSPQRKISTFLTDMTQNMEKKLKPFSIKVKYEDSSKNPFSETFNFNLSYLKGLGWMEPPIYKISKNIEKISKNIGHLATGFKKLRVITQTKKEKQVEEKKQIEKIKALQKKKN